MCCWGPNFVSIAEGLHMYAAASFLSTAHKIHPGTQSTQPFDFDYCIVRNSLLFIRRSICWVVKSNTVSAISQTLVCFRLCMCLNYSSTIWLVKSMHMGIDGRKETQNMLWIHPYQKIWAPTIKRLNLYGIVLLTRLPSFPFPSRPSHTLQVPTTPSSQQTQSFY